MSTTLVVWNSGTAADAERARGILQDLVGTDRESVHDAAMVSWPRGSRKPSTCVLPDLRSDQALGEEFWGVLFGVIFYSPLLGAAVSRATDAISSLAEVGIDDTFVNRVRDSVTPGTWALFALGSDALVDRVRGVPGLRERSDLLLTKLDRRQVGALRQVFAG
jgi:uncharacterized membrane protein